MRLRAVRIPRLPTPASRLPMPALRTVTLLTDFGTADGFVAAMKGVILSMAPEARLVDAGHDVAAGDVEAAAWALDQYVFLYPDGTVHVVVVDPGVGTARRALAAAVDGRYLVAPDNGVATRVFRRAERVDVVAIENAELLRAEVSSTFHGRDVFAPAAAHLALGGALELLGPSVAEPLRLGLPEPRLVEGRRGAPARAEGTVVHVDRFGNLITDISGAWLRTGSWVVRVGEGRAGTAIPLRRTYGDVRPGAAAAVIGSAGTLEVAVREGSATRTLGAGRGARVVCEATAG